MLVTAFLDGQNFDPEAKRVMGVAFEMARAALRLADRADPATEILAKRIIALAKEGMRDPSLLCDWALEDMRKPPHVLIRTVPEIAGKAGRAQRQGHGRE
jgi:hypothetical protein